MSAFCLRMRGSCRSLSRLILTLLGLCTIVSTPASGQGSRRPLLARAKAEPTARVNSPARWIDALNAMPEVERRARIGGYGADLHAAATIPCEAPAAGPGVPAMPYGANGFAGDSAGLPMHAPKALPAERPVAGAPALVPAPSYAPDAIILAPIILEGKRCAPVSMEGIHVEAISARNEGAPPDIIRASSLFPDPPGAARIAPAPGRPFLTATPDHARADGKLASFLADCHDLSRRGLDYKFGSNHPGNGGLDCSGTVQYLLRSHDVPAVPRQSNMQYQWLAEKGTLRKVSRFASVDAVLRDLKPGDLLFWKDTYRANRSPNVTHVMIYLGRDARTGKHMMFGARNARARGVHGNPVDVFEFGYPFEEGKGKFIAYGSVPDLHA